MTKKTRIILLCLISIYCSCKGQSKFEMQQQDFPDYGISIKIPLEWMYKEGSENIKNKIFTSYYKENETDTFNTISYSIIYTPIQKNITLDSLINLNIQALKNQAIEGSLIELTDYKIDSFPSIIYRFDFNIGNIKVTSIDVIAFVEDNCFLIQFTGEKSKFDKYFTTIDEIIKSIKVKPTNLNSLTENYDFEEITETYVNTEYKIKIDFPIGWYYINDFGGNIVQVFKEVEKTENYVSMAITVVSDMKNPELKSFHEYILPYYDKIKKPDTDYEITDLENGNYKVIKTKFQSNMNNMDVILISYLFIDNDRAINFICVSTPNIFLENEKIFEDVFKTLKIE